MEVFPATMPAYVPGAVPPGSAARREIPASSLNRMALWAAACLIFVRFTFLHEIIALTMGIRSFLPPIFLVLAVLGLLVSGTVKRSFQNRAVMLWIGFAAMLVASVPFSSWPGGSTAAVISFLQNEFLIALLIAGVISNWKDLKIMLYAIALAGITNELTAIYMSRTGGGRLGVGIVTLGNANDFAAQLLLILPICGFFLLSKSVGNFMRFLMLPVCGYACYLILRSGSRGALVAMGLLYVILILKARGMQRIWLSVGVALMGTIVFMAMPGEVVQRLRTVFGGDEANVATSEALESTKGRRYLFFRSIEMTLRHPIFGVGVDQFSTVEGFDAKSQGNHGIFMQTHNSFTQVSSEAGVLTLILLLLSLGSSWRTASRAVREARLYRNANFEAAAMAILVAIAAFCTASFFLSLAYRFYFPTLIGLSAGLSTALRNEIANSRQLVAAR
jgi:O-antigen ligase